ncbi:MAG TPA: CHASE4 domain-containing protein [Aggregatilinea sp.]|uniref:sensor histidine kinase n=1 Tax=Aggregatilinea sp. TaxID=2806333 RepID=UPI002C516C3B|nr:CHASE4 domain-containing protein [Aggregatilinea sp.]HML23383.1 CHASE4 domain-containing protein [Aggregatilinea sp.]
MPLRWKTALIIGVAICGLLLCIFLFARLIVLNSFEDLEHNSAHRDLERITNALDNQVDHLEKTTTDWAYWDDTYVFVQDLNDAYKAANLTDGTYTTLNLSFMLFLDDTGQIVYGKAYDVELGQEVSLPVGLDSSLASDLPIADGSATGLRSGVLMLPDGPMLIAAGPILTSNMEGPAAGTLVFGQAFGDTLLTNLAESTRLSLEMFRWDDPHLSKDIRAISGTLSAQSPLEVSPLSSSTLAGYVLIPDLYGNPALIIRTESPRGIYAEGQRTLAFFMAVTLGISLIMAIVLLILLERSILTTAQMGAVLEHSSDIIVLTRADGRIAHVNPAFRQKYNGESIQFAGRPLASLFTGAFNEVVSDAVRDVLSTGTPRQLDADLAAGSGKDLYMNVALSPIQVGRDPVSGVVCSLRDISEHKRLEAKLRQTLAHETELKELKSRFVSMASHELRTPLAVILVSSDILLHYADRLNSDQRIKELRRIQTEVDRMVAVLEDVLTLSRTEADTFEIRPVSTDLVDLCEDLAARAQKSRKETHVIHVEVNGDRDIRMVDRNLITYILNNLLSNALKYSPPDSPVTLTLTYQPDEIRFQVTDKGIGIPPKDQGRLFDAFFRASNVDTITGTGLGLAIVKQAVDVQGGTITCESGVGSGSTFTVTIPALPAPEQSTGHAPSEAAVAIQGV